MPNNSYPHRLFKPKSLYFLMLCAISAQAQEARDPVLRTVDVVGSLEAATLNLSTPSQTGSRTGLSAKELPASLESIDSQTIAERGDTQIIDA
ncbi:MAG: TonB-dependent siderophore receptor, partial [Candidatus Accumulibacter sp.]|nr:TonB-dependent siderophore receptor [Accumulibacter sp.]